MGWYIRLSMPATVAALFFYEHHFLGGKLPDVEGIRTTEWKYAVYKDTKFPSFNSKTRDYFYGRI